ncbi:MAG: hypothetical protein RKO66_09035 [Candidatus Contendobacter sp.]|nr:hypothetical protein [Candidatus Contendobacter sp.]MDS4059796.1 hypothetical protein [Candidatus Contendobacter sp.]
MSEEKPKAAFVTFYSFKGGVGRSMALINTAGILAGRGFRVLVIDLDLEAPGLSYLDPDAPDVAPDECAPRQRPLQLGFVDLLSDAKERGEAADLFALSLGDLANRYTQPYRLPEKLCEFKDGSLHIMPAGKFDGHYGERLDALNLHELYQDGLGEPLIRAFKKRLKDADLYDYILVDSRTGFSDEAGICTRDLADYLMILSGLNRQNVEGTCEFLKALRVATDGKKPFQIILSPVPNGEDALVDQREEMARKSFEAAWGAKVDLSLQIPYHPQLALTEEPHIFRRRRGYLFEAYRAIEQGMHTALGYDVQNLMQRVEKALQKRNYLAALHDLRYIVRLNKGYIFAMDFGMYDRLFIIDETASESSHIILGDTARQEVIKFIIDNFPIVEKNNLIGTQELLKRLEDNSVDLADRLYKRIIDAAPNDKGILDAYAIFLENKRGDLEGAKVYYERALEADPEHVNNLINYGQFLVEQNRLIEWEDALLSAFERIDRSNAGIVAAKIFFLLWLVARMQGKGAECWERHFKFVVKKGFRRYPWNFEPMLAQAKKVLPPAEFEYAEALARAFLDEGQVANLEQYERWRILEPLDPMEAGSKFSEDVPASVFSASS